MTRQHYSSPTFSNITELILLTKYGMHQPLIVKDDPLGNFETYVVLDNTISSEVTIDNAIINGYIILQSKFGTTEVAIDNITVENQPKSSNVATTNATWLEYVQENWIVGFAPVNFSQQARIINSRCFVTNFIEFIYSHDMMTYPAGTYEFYSDIDPQGGIYFRDNASNFFYFTSVRENSIYRNTLVLANDTDLDGFYATAVVEPINIWAINSFVTNDPGIELAVKNINYIVDSDEFSNNDMKVRMVDGKTELVTRAYVDNRSTLTDEVTLTADKVDVQVANDSDYNTVFNSAWDDALPTTGYTLDPTGSGTVSYSNGVFEIDSSGSNIGARIIDFPAGNAISGQIFRIILDVQLSAISANARVSFTSGIEQYRQYNETSIDNGTKWMYLIQIPEGVSVESMGYSNINVPVNITLVDNDLYPSKTSFRIKEIDYIIDNDGESIDGSDTPMSDARRELITRAYVDNQVKVDKITIEKEGVFEVIGLETSMTPLIQNNWINSTAELFSGYSLVESDGKIFYPSSSNPAILRDSNVPTFTAGTYEFYSDVDITYAQFKFTDTGFTDYFFNASVKEGSLYRNTLVLAGDIQFETFEANVVPISRPVNIWIINRYKIGSYPEEITIKNIDRIIGSNGYSVDDDYIQTVSRDNELVTKGYVDSRASDADEVTLTRSSPLPVTTTDVSFQTVMNTAWDNNYVTSGFSLKDNTTYLNGIFTCLSTDNGLMEIPPGNSINGRIHHAILNILLDPANNEFVKFEDANNNLLTSLYDPVLLDNGEYLYTLQIPDLSTPTTIDFNAPSDFTFKFVKMDEYPPVKSFKVKEIDHIIDDDNESIDGSDTPMSDEHRELVTRGYVDNEIILSSVTASNGLTKIGSDIQLGGLLTGNTSIATDANDFIITDSSQAEMSMLSIGDKTTYLGVLNTGSFTYSGFFADDHSASMKAGSNTPGANLVFNLIVGSGANLDDSDSMKGMTYEEDYSANSIGVNHDPRWIPDLEYVETYIGSVTHWLKTPYEPDSVNQPGVYKQQLTPADADAKTVKIDNASHGFNQIMVQNAENETGNDNYTGSTVLLTTSSVDYDSQTFISHHGADYYDATLRNRGMIGTDSSLIISAYNATDKQGAPAFVDFRVGDDYWNQKSIFTLTTNGLEMTLADKKIFYEYGKTPIADPASWTDLRLNTVTGEIYAAAGSAPLTQSSENHTIIAADVTNNYIDLLQTPNLTEHLFIFHNGVYLTIGDDFTISTNRITFIAPIVTGDKVTFKYSY